MRFPSSASRAPLFCGALLLLVGCASAAARADDSVGPDGTTAGAGGEPASGGGAGTGVATSKGGAGGKGGVPGGAGGTDGGAGTPGDAGTGGGSEGGDAGASGKGGATEIAGGAGKSGGSGASGKAGAAGKSGGPGTAGAGGKAPTGGAAGKGGAATTGGGAGTAGGGGAQATAGTGGAAGTASAGAAGQAGSSACGNGVLDAGEECDDGNGSGSAWCKKCKVVCVYGKKRGSHCYELLEDTFDGYFDTDWVSANTFCNTQSKGFGHLVTFDEFDAANNAGPEEDWVVQNVVAPGSSSAVWIGYSDRATEGVFTRYDGSPMVYKRWHAGEPNDSKGEDCVELTSKSSSWGWNDNDCDSVRAYVCEYEPVVNGP